MQYQIKKTLFVLFIVLMSVTAFAETKTITWKNPNGFEADRYEITVSKFVGTTQDFFAWAGELFLTTDKELVVDLEEGSYMVTVVSCLGSDCLDPSEPYYFEVVEHNTAYDIDVK